MADKSIAVLNLGSQTISLGVFEESKSGLILKKYATDSVLADPANEAIRNTQIKVAIEDLVEQLGVSKSQVQYAVSGQSVFTRFVKLPALGDSDIEQLVSFEAQQHIPYPIEDVAWDWHPMGSNGAEREVAIVAVKKSLLNDVDNLVNQAGLVSKHAESAPISLANSFLYSYPENSDSSLIIDAGAKSTNLIYIEGKRVFIRSVNVSGVSVTSAISKDYQVDYSEAEKYKVEAGRIALNGAYLEQWDEGTATLATIISNALSRLPSEIARTTNYYRSQHSGSTPVRVYLAGMATSLPYFKEFIEEKLSIPTEYFDSLKNVKLAESINQEDVTTKAHTMGELVGLALSASKRENFSIDLIPDSVGESREADRKKPFFIVGLAALVTGAAVWAGSQFYFSKTASAKLAEVKDTVTKIEPYKKQLVKLKQSRKKLDAISKEYSGVIEGRYRSLQLLEEIRSHLASESVWLDSIEELVDYNFAILDGGFEGEKDGVYVSNSFASLTYGSPSIKVLPKPKNKKDIPVLNAVKITGYWRENSKGQGVVYDLLNKIKSDEDSSFTFEIGKKALDDNQILKIQSVIPKEGIKAPFTLILPISSPVSVIK